MSTKAISEAVNRLYRAAGGQELDRAALAEVLTLAAAEPLSQLPRTRDAMGRDPSRDRKDWKHPKGTLLRLRPPAEPIPLMLPKHPELARVLINCRNGFYRQKALQVLPVPEDAFQLGCLIWRLDEWVAPVRLEAEERLLTLMARIPPEAVADLALALLPRIEAMWRLSDRGLQLWHALLARDDEVRGMLIGRLMAAKGGGVRGVFLRLMRDPMLDEALPMIARRAAHPSLRKAALAWQMEGVVAYEGVTPQRFGVSFRTFGPLGRPFSIDPDREALMQDAMRDRSVHVRKTAADMLPRLADHAPEAARRLALQMTWDRHPGVRQRAEWFVKNRTSE
ncbi:hypothetical protein [Pararhodobacter sp. CCB-MM2]|uniref:hypothetical protein n=1 Tax=Pararhodobacter sp. CCB-MM2 TaxID=1786003 RepID=UPI000829F603|nr:hypothetical protein [Pararhodobacter sp. CCB-MM2]